MDLLSILRRKIESLTDGQHKPGLLAVLRHLEVAYQHLLRGEGAEEDESAFTDTIYRCNQAFEGGLKEAYRVLTGKDPSKVTPYQIETHLETVLRPRVLAQLKIYRTDWRNPSTHDYKLDFDSSEAFIAISAVSAFTSVLLDQISERLAFVAAEERAAARNTGAGSQPDPALSTFETVRELTRTYLSASSTDGADLTTESQLIGGLHGFISAMAPELRVDVEYQLAPNLPFTADLLVSKGQDRVIVELKRKFHRQNYKKALLQVAHYMQLSGIKQSVLGFLPDKAGSASTALLDVQDGGGHIAVIAQQTEA